MKINEIICTRVRIPLVDPMKWSGGTRHAAPAIIVQIKTDEGITGIGECVGPTLPTIEAIVNNEFKQFLIGQNPMRTEYLVRRMEEFARNWSHIGAYAISGLEMALLDIKGKVLNTPVYELLGGCVKKDIPYMGYLFIGDPLDNARRAAEFKKQGFNELKLKVGRDLKQDAETIEAIREAVGWDMKIRIDANMNWSVPTAIKWIKELTKFDLQYVEQPVPFYDLEGMAAVRKAVDVPIAADESCTSVYSALQLLKYEACDVFVVYVSEAGGMTRAKQIAEIADAAGKWCSIGTWAETGVATMAGAHVIGSSANFPFANDTHYPLQTDDVLKVPLSFINGKLILPAGPGLGIELDETKMDILSKCNVRESVFFDNIDDENMPMIGQII